ncbi:uncharacterized protein BDW47DRAFT_118424 [Aspergillus candidus]|uniref:Uncharacterized protein n=1 Tax=Aspergillus candidus TaxID=41067 RepID=A0A2I2F8H9_ASPCN|nr:hypothetical protein BDW47DRAFT_118424 [Aspergillus candidus]PLB36944.1 hypothetical protein BDW47DRAFT_118424 [Aspergillus candidus]
MQIQCQCGPPHTYRARLDDPNRLAPVGVIGELVAEGPGIARGYINNETGNTDLFLDSPPWAKEWESIVASMGRSYRTGDLVRYADDGELIFVGRRDRQVKLRGQRIELEDIETKIKQHLQLPEASILLEVVHNVDGDTGRMTKDMELEIEGLRARIAEVLPAYMWPVAWIPLKEVPLGPTGKLDRRKLLSLGTNFFTRAMAKDPI